MILHYIVSFSALLTLVEPARILGIFPVPSVSHQVVFRALMEELAKRGHHLVILTTDPVNYKDPEYSNITEIDVHDFSYEIFREDLNFVRLGQKLSKPVYVLPLYYECMLKIYKKQMEVPAMKKLLEDPEQKFDLCFFESLNSFMYPLKDRFNCSLIMISSVSSFINTFESMGVPTNPVLYPDVLSEYFGELDFWQRLDVVHSYIYIYYVYYWMYLPRYDEMARNMFGDSVRPIDEIEKSADLMFINVHPVIGGIRPTVPSIVFMGSMHIKKAKPLPSHLKKILDDAENGAIYFSLGSNVKSVDLSEEKRNAFLDAFKDMPYTILWKWENETLPNKPKNVFISKWMPQQDILAHPNIKVFITQGGQQSMEEAIDRKVPLIGIPFLGDQKLNVQKMVQFGIGLKLDLAASTKDTIKDTVMEVISNPSFRQNMSKLHDLIYDQPQTSMERAIWWTEYVLRHGGAPHLRSPAINMPFYKYFLLDIIVFLLICCFLALIVPFMLIKIIVSFIHVPSIDLNINLNHLKKLQ